MLDLQATSFFNREHYDNGRYASKSRTQPSLYSVFNQPFSALGCGPFVTIGASYGQRKSEVVRQQERLRVYLTGNR